MKKYTVFIEGKAYSSERLERATKFITDVLGIENTQAGDIVMSFLSEEGKEDEIMALVKEYGVVDFTK